MYIIYIYVVRFAQNFINLAIIIAKAKLKEFSAKLNMQLALLPYIIILYL